MNYSAIVGRIVQGSMLATLALLCGCATKTVERPAPAGITYQKDTRVTKFWLAEGFNFKGYDTLVILPTKVDCGPAKDAQETELLNWATGFLQVQLVADIQTNGVFQSVITNAAASKPGAKVLTMENTIIEYARGSGHARFWGGTFGSGQPMIRVRGKMSDGDKALFQFETFRSGDSAKARLFTSEDKILQTLDIQDLTKDMSDFIQDPANQVKKKK